MGWNEMMEEKRGGMQGLMDSMREGRMNQMAAEEEKKGDVWSGLLKLFGGFASCFIPVIGPAIGVPIMFGGGSDIIRGAS